MHLLATTNGYSPVRLDLSPLPGHDKNLGSTSEIQIILRITFEVIGALAFLMIIIAGFRYVISAGDPQKAARARETIIYALVGLAVALTAEAIVTFVVGHVG